MATKVSRETRTFTPIGPDKIECSDDCFILGKYRNTFYDAGRVTGTSSQDICTDSNAPLVEGQTKSLGKGNGANKFRACLMVQKTEQKYPAPEDPVEVNRRNLHRQA